MRTFYFLKRWALATSCLLGLATAAQAQAPANDNCSGAIALPVGAVGTCTTTVGTTVNATASYPTGVNSTGCSGGTPDDDVWYTFVAPAGGGVTVNVVPTSNTANFSPVVEIRAGASCPGTTPNNISPACGDTSTPPTTLSTYALGTGLTAGATYYVRVYSYANNAAGSQGAFTICVTTSVACASPAVLSPSNVTGTSATISFAPTAGVTNYTVTYAPTSGATAPVTQTVTGSPVNLTGLSALTSYTVTVASNCSAGGTAIPTTVQFTSGNPILTNDECTTAVTLIQDINCNPTAGTTIGATQTLPYALSCSSFGGANDVWYKFVATNTTAKVTLTCLGTLSAVVQALSGACPVTASNPSLGCMTAYSFSGGVTTLSLSGLTVATTYYVRVYSTSATNPGNFTLCVTGAPCLPPTNLVASAITPTGATFTFTPPATGGPYTLTLVPTGPGTTIVKTGTASPFVVTGLAPGTTYTASLVANCLPGQGSVPATTTLTTLFACPPVTGLVVSNVTGTGATVSFVPPAGGGAVSYLVSYTGGTTQTQTATGSPVVLSGLVPGTKYTLVVTTNCTGGTVAPTSVGVGTTFTTPAVCTPVTGLVATNVTANSASLAFAGPVNGTGYTIVYTPVGGSTQVTTAASTPATLTGLLAGQQYTASVIVSCTASNQTSATASTTFTTPAAAPTGATATPLTPTSGQVTFVVPTGAVAYTITYTGGGTTGSSTTTGPPITLTALLPNTTYTVTLVATYPGGGNSAPVTLTFTTPQVLGTRTALAGGQLVVYPNPAHTAFTLALPALGGAVRTARVEVFNGLGQRVSQQTLSLGAGGTQVGLSAAGLPAGLYLLRVQAGAETATTRLVVE